MKAEAPAAISILGRTGEQKPIESDIRTQPITRLFRPDPAVLSDLVEALFRLLTESPESQAPGVLNPSDSACFRSTPE